MEQIPPLRNRHSYPVSLSALLQESIFGNPLITLDNTPLHFPHWISAGLTRVQDICYLAIPGFLPPLAIHELLYTNFDTEPHPNFNRSYRLYPVCGKALSFVTPPPTIQHPPPRTSNTTPHVTSTWTSYTNPLLQYLRYNIGPTPCFLKRLLTPLSGKTNTVT